MRLTELSRAVGGTVLGGDPEITGISHDSRRVRPGELFVAIPGARADGARFVRDALARGAAAICGGEAAEGVPSLVVADPREALGLLSAELQGHPARELLVVGITGSLGKTSTALLAQQALTASGIPTGVIGSLGIRYDGEVIETGMTTPEAPAIHGALRAMRSRGARAAVMEVTSHSLLLRRVAGLELALGALTNLVPDEHLEFHPTPEHYIRTKLRFFELLRPGAPLIVNADDTIARQVTRELDRPVVDVSAGDSADAPVAVRDLRMSGRGSSFVLDVRCALPRPAGGELPPLSLEVRLPILGRQQVANAAIAATVALLAGGSPAGVATALSRATPMRRRMEVIHDAGPLILDDTVGHPESIAAVFEAGRAIPHERMRVVYAIRGLRGPTINERNALALAAEVAAAGADLVVTAAEDTADERNRVSDEEREVALGTLRAAGAPFTFEPRLATAVAEMLGRSGPRDLVLLLGAQGMDRGAELAKASLGRG
jgi:UDP-N-acetylmuramoyl-L-alanyl-D-glutamate--2,6-diaminopimelate ligase